MPTPRTRGDAPPPDRPDGHTPDPDKTVRQDRKTQSRLDPRQPLVIDTRELGRRPGSMRPLRRTAPAPGSLGVELIRTPEGAPLELDLRLESVVEGVLVTGEVTGPVTGECGRCLEPFEDTVVVQIQQLYVYSGDGTPEDDDDDVDAMEGDLLDLEPALRDAVVLALPLSPLCSEDCGGLCPVCGERVDDLPPGHAHDVIDARWAALRAAAEQESQPDDQHQPPDQH